VALANAKKSEKKFEEFRKNLDGRQSGISKQIEEARNKIDQIKGWVVI
jgi:hypothetical protein